MDNFVGFAEKKNARTLLKAAEIDHCIDRIPPKTIGTGRQVGSYVKKSYCSSGN